jgi:hypothetical protein
LYYRFDISVHRTGKSLGSLALAGNATGSFNTASGGNALLNNLTGSGNIAMGYNSGSAVTGSNNIDIGHEGVATDSGIIRIGTGSIQKSAFIAGVFTRKITGSAVYISSAGQLGVLASSERYKTAIASMSEESSKLQQLRPVTFRLKGEPHGALQFGLIAEEVDKVYPELVIRDEAGAIEGVRYDELAPMLLKEMQLQGVQLRRQRQQLATEAAERVNIRHELEELKQQNQSMRAALSKILARDERVALR